jgi:hypothetical protein
LPSADKAFDEESGALKRKRGCVGAELVNTAAAPKQA